MRSRFLCLFFFVITLSSFCLINLIGCSHNDYLAEAVRQSSVHPTTADYNHGVISALLCALEAGYGTSESTWSTNLSRQEFESKCAAASLSPAFTAGAWEFMYWSMTHRESVSDVCDWFGIDTEIVCNFLGIKPETLLLSASD